MIIKGFLRQMQRLLPLKEHQLAPGAIYKRHLSSPEATLLAEKLQNAFGRKISSNDVQDVAALLRNTDAGMIGRIAGDVEDHILNYYMVRSSADLYGKTTPAHVEIGVLFGGSLLMTLNGIRSTGSDHIAVGIDPLDGYYGETLDPVTKLPITEENVQYNLNRFGVDASRVRIIKAVSESASAIRAIRLFPIASLWIDGDHTYDGVKRDWQNYARFVMRDGYVLIDNYHDQAYNYPGIDKFIDEDLLPTLKGWEAVTSLNRTILFRKTD